MSNNTIKLSNKMIETLNAQAEKIGIPVEEITQKVEEYIYYFCQMDEYAAKKELIKLQYTAPAPKEDPAEGSADNASEENAEQATETANTEQADGTAEQADEQEKSKKRIYTLEDILSENKIAEVGIENVKKLCKEMRTAYREKYPKCWLKATKPADFPENLRKAVKDDVTLLSLIKDKCKIAANFDEAARNNIIRLMSLDLPNKRFGGLSKMGFPFCIRGYLGDFADIIGEYFKTFIHEDTDGGNRLPIPKGIKFPEDTPVAPEEEVPAEAEQQICNKDVAEAPTEAKQPIGNKYNLPNAEEPIAIPVMPARKLDSHKVINRLGDVRSFIALADKLRKAGIDPELLLEKEDGVKAMIKNVIKAMGEI